LPAVARRLRRRARERGCGAHQAASRLGARRAPAGAAARPEA